MLIHNSLNSAKLKQLLKSGAWVRNTQSRYPLCLTLAKALNIQMIFALHFRERKPDLETALRRISLHLIV